VGDAWEGRQTNIVDVHESIPDMIDLFWQNSGMLCAVERDEVVDVPIYLYCRNDGKPRFLGERMSLATASRHLEYCKRRGWKVPDALMPWEL
jgi:hypothetical protein